MHKRAVPLFADGSGIVYLQGPFVAPEFFLFDFAFQRRSSTYKDRVDAEKGYLQQLRRHASDRIIFDRIAENSDILQIKSPGPLTDAGFVPRSRL